MVWIKRLLILIVGIGIVLLLVIIPVSGSFLITNSRFRFPERNVVQPDTVGLSVTSVEFESEDGVTLRAWWDPGQSDRAVIVFAHGLNRSRQELVERGGESRRLGYGVLLLDLRNHGESDDAYTTLGVAESQDVCAGAAFVNAQSPGRPLVFWGVSLGAATSVLAAARCDGADAVIADSAFISFESTVSHHVGLILGLPKFPVASLLIFLTRTRMGFTLEEADVERAVQSMPQVPMLFIAGSEDVRMPPSQAQRLYEASANPKSEILVVSGASHGRAFNTDPTVYLETAFSFLDRSLIR